MEKEKSWDDNKFKDNVQLFRSISMAFTDRLNKEQKSEAVINYKGSKFHKLWLREM